VHVRFAQIEPTTRCNFTCGFCCGRHMDQTDLDYGRFEAIVAALPGLEHVELQGEGEPLLHPRFFDMLGHLRDRGIRTSFITNGSLMTPERAAQVVALGVQKVIVSMESADPATFQALRGGSLEKVRRRLQNLLDARRAAGADRPGVGLAVTVLRRTQADLAGIVGLYDALGLDGGVSFQPLQSMPTYARHYDAELADQTLSPREVEDLWFGLARAPVITRIQGARRAPRGFYDELMATWRSGSRACPWLEAGVYVDRRGEATPCCRVKDPSAHGLGRPVEDGLAQVGAARDGLRRTLAEGRTPTACEGCDLARSILATPAERAVQKAGAALRWVTGRSSHPRLPVV
jgi:MoaA/NifB/PqqE/SkfB family radical SAM enzyme